MSFGLFFCFVGFGFPKHQRGHVSYKSENFLRMLDLFIYHYIMLMVVIIIVIITVTIIILTITIIVIII